MLELSYVSPRSLFIWTAIQSVALAIGAVYVWKRRQVLVGKWLFVSRGVVYYVVMLFALVVILGVVSIVGVGFGAL